MKCNDYHKEIDVLTFILFMVQHWDTKLSKIACVCILPCMKIKKGV